MGEENSAVQNWIVCSCGTCSGHIEFEAERAGETVQCPHCGIDTLLYVPAHPSTHLTPKSERTRMRVNPSPIPKDKKGGKLASIVVEKVLNETGSESTIELRVALAQKRVTAHADRNMQQAGSVIGALSVVGGVICLCLSLVSCMDTHDNEAPNRSGMLFLIGVGLIFEGWVVNALFFGGAEIIRLLQDLNSRRIGSMTQHTVRYVHKCSECNASAQPGQSRCNRCGAEFKSPS